jgi:protein-L-isoaspartate(D-aspartate) O-methyltransferase
MTATLQTVASAGELREAMVNTLLDEGHITSEAVEVAFRAVPREQFAPAGTDLATLYDAHDVVVTKRGPDGRAMSSISAPSIQAFMIEQAQLRPGMRVLEIGSGGVNAAYLAEIVGPTGRVITVDIDPDVTDRAAACLDATGYSSRVRVLQADAHHGVPDEAPFDVVLVTVQCWDIAPAWLKQLTPTGVLVLPLTIAGGVSRSIAFRRDGDRLTSHDAKMCGFVDMQGIGHHPEDRLTVAGNGGAEVIVAFDNGVPRDLQLDKAQLAEPSVELWSGVHFPHATSWADLYLYFACYLDGFCRLSTREGRSYPAPKTGGDLPYAAARASSLAYLIYRPLDNSDEGIEFGARGFGADGQLAARAIIDQVQAWDVNARQLDPWFSYVPAQSLEVVPDSGVALLREFDGSISQHWDRAVETADDPNAAYRPRETATERRPYDAELAKTHGMVIIHWPQPHRGGRVTSVPPAALQTPRQGG